MHLSRLYIENYRSVQKIDIKFERGKNVIVGRNNSGKSNILKAIDLILGEYSPTYNKSENITDSDFYCNETNKQIFIWCEIQRSKNENNDLEEIDFSEIGKSAFFRLYSDSYFSNEIRVFVSDFKASEKNKIFEFCSEEGEIKIENDKLKKKWLGGKSYCKSNYKTEFSDKSNFAIAFTAFKNDEGKIQKELVLLYRENEQNHWIQGVNCNLRNILIQSAIIPAFRDPKDQLRITQFSWFGKLLKAYIKTDSQDLNNAFESVKVASDELFKGLKDKVAEKEIDIAFPNTTISFQFNPDTKQDIHKSTLIYVNDGFNSELKDKGAGIQSAVIISLFDFYVRNIAHSGSSLLAVEEPELYLHPHGRRVISNRLSKFVDNGKNQVILTTHTPEFLTNIHETQNIIVVRKTDNATTAKNIYFDSPKRKQILIKKQNAELFFADAVILSEGSDKYFIEEVARCFGKDISLGENWVNDNNVSIINCGGKTELWKYAEILTELEIPFITTADFDFFRDGLNEYFTKLNLNKELTDSLNSIKSKIKINGKYKSIDEIDPVAIKEEIKKFFVKLITHHIFIFSGELEHFYKVKPAKSDKEGGMIKILGQMIEENKSIEYFLEISEYKEMLKLFIQTSLKLEIKEKIIVANDLDPVKNGGDLPF